MDKFGVKRCDQLPKKYSRKLSIQQSLTFFHRYKMCAKKVNLLSKYHTEVRNIFNNSNENTMYANSRIIVHSPLPTNLTLLLFLGKKNTRPSCTNRRCELVVQSHAYIDPVGQCCYSTGTQRCKHHETGQGIQKCPSENS